MDPATGIRLPTVFTVVLACGSGAGVTVTSAGSGPSPCAHTIVGSSAAACGKTA
jgi:hypothetical protein